MGDVVNLNRFRKARRRTEKQASAAVNRAKFGKTKAERRSEDHDRKAAERSLDSKKIEDGESE